VEIIRLPGGLLILSMKGNKSGLDAFGVKKVDLSQLGNKGATIDVSPSRTGETAPETSTNAAAWKAIFRPPAALGEAIALVGDSTKLPTEELDALKTG
jgi:hypothetical protein